MRFRDFDVLFSLSIADNRDLNLRARAFVEGVFAELRTQRPEAPWCKLYIDIGSPGQSASFMPAFPKVGVSSAGAHIALPDPALLTARGEAIRPLLAGAVMSTRALVRESSDWDDPWFWDLIDRMGSHKGPYRQRLKPVTDRKSKTLYHLTYEWDEDGTKLYVDARAQSDDDELLGRSVVGSYPGQWEWFTGQVPSRIRLTPEGMALLDHEGSKLQTIPRPG